MKIEDYRKAAKLMAQISAHKGVVTSLSQLLYKTKCVIRKEEIEKKIHEKVLLLSNLRKEFDEL